MTKIYQLFGPLLQQKFKTFSVLCFIVSPNLSHYSSLVSKITVNLQKCLTARHEMYPQEEWKTKCHIIIFHNTGNMKTQNTVDTTRINLKYCKELLTAYCLLSKIFLKITLDSVLWCQLKLRMFGDKISLISENEMQMLNDTSLYAFPLYLFGVWIKTDYSRTDKS